MTVLAHAIHVDVATHHDALEHIKDFALSQSWTIQDYRKNNTEWQTGGFVAGTESYLQLESAGHGAQTLHFRIRAQNTLADAQSEWWETGAFKAGATAINTGSFQHPVFTALPGPVTNWNFANNTQVSVLPTNISKIWLFGNATFIAVVMQFSPTFVQVFGFGSIELKDVLEDEGNCWFNANQAGFNNGSKWYNITSTVGPFDQELRAVLYDDNQATFRSSVIFSAAGAATGQAFSLAKAIVVNGYTDHRPQRKSDIIVQHDIDSLFRQLGQIPVFRMDVSNLSIGEKRFYGATDEYLVFPNLNDTKNKGLSFRIQ